MALNVVKKLSRNAHEAVHNLMRCSDQRCYSVECDITIDGVSNWFAYFDGKFELINYINKRYRYAYTEDEARMIFETIVKEMKRVGLFDMTIIIEKIDWSNGYIEVVDKAEIGTGE